MTADPKKLLKYLLKERESFSRYESTLYNIIMNRNRSHGDSAAEYELDEEEGSVEASYRNKIDLLYHGIVTLYELLNLNSRKDLVAQEYKEAKTTDGGEFKINFVPQWDDFHSSGFEIITREIDLLSAMLGETKKTGNDTSKETNEKNTFIKLLGYLQATGYYITHLLPSEPKSENDINRIMDTLLHGSFSADYIRKPQVCQSIKNFRPDGGLKSIGTAIEYKFIVNQKELASAIEGIYADISGYSGSKDWTNFISVFYMTDNFTTTETIEKDIREKGLGKWHAIVVPGKGNRERAKKAAPAKTRSRVLKSRR